MAKGDTISVALVTGAVYALEASKAGRTLVQTTRPRTKPVWLDVVERTRTGRPTGNQMTFRLEAVAAIEQTMMDVPDEPKAKAKHTAANEELGL